MKGRMEQREREDGSVNEVCGSKGISMKPRTGSGEGVVHSARCNTNETKMVNRVSF